MLLFLEGLLPDSQTELLGVRPLHWPAVPYLLSQIRFVPRTACVGLLLDEQLVEYFYRGGIFVYFRVEIIAARNCCEMVTDEIRPSVPSAFGPNDIAGELLANCEALNH